MYRNLAILSKVFGRILAIQSLKKLMILALSNSNIAFWLYVANMFCVLI
jgi:hypothetical protein